MRFNHIELSKIDELMHQHKNKEALKALNKYAREYPRDNTIPLLYADLLYRMGDYSSAHEYLNQFELPENANKILRNKYQLLLIKLAMEERKFDKAFHYYMKAIKQIDDSKEMNGYDQILSSTTLYFFLKQRAGLLRDDEIEIATSYLNTQILAFDEERTIEHVIQSSEGSISDSFNMDKYSFTVDIRKLFNMVNASKIDVPSLYSSPVLRERFYKYENVGTTPEGEILDYFVASSFYDTDEIVALYPAKFRSGMDYTDITPRRNVTTNKVRRLSQIEKFNRKYN